MAYSPAMRALVQRVSRASVGRVEARARREIGPGLLVLLGVTREDGPEQADRLAAKVRALRVFADAHGQHERRRSAIARSSASASSRCTATRAAATARASPRRRPASRPSRSTSASASAPGAKRGVFGAYMAVELVDDGPVTLLLET